MNSRLLKQLEPFKISYSNDVLKIENNSTFLNLSTFTVYYEISKMSEVIKSGKLSLAAKPQETKEFPFKINCALNENLPYYLNIYVLEKDHINSFNQFLLKEENKLTYHIDLDFDKINKFQMIDNSITLDDFQILDIDNLELTKLEKSNKSIDVLYDSSNYSLLKYIMQTKDNRLSLRYTYLTKCESINKLGYCISFDKSKYNKLVYFGEGPDNSDKHLKIGIESLYTVNLDNKNINRSNVRIVSILDNLNHGIRIEYADTLFNIQIIDNKLFINLRDEYSFNKIKDNSEYSFETLIDIL